MSHFKVLVIGDNVEEQLQPYHEFECTGVDDQYVQDVDITNRTAEEYHNNKTSVLVAPDGTICEKYDDKFYRDPTPEESKLIGPIAGTGCGHGFSWRSQDWGDGKGYRAKIPFTPESYESKEMNTDELKTFKEFIEYWEGLSEVKYNETPDLGGKHKYGYFLTDENGEVVKVIDRTNPNKKWDWWQIGGRYRGSMRTKKNTMGIVSPRHWTEDYGNHKTLDACDVDQCLKGDLDLASMQQKAWDEAHAFYTKLSDVCKDHPAYIPWKEYLGKYKDNIDQARKEYNDQPVVNALNASTDDELRWLLFGDDSIMSMTHDEYCTLCKLRAFSSYAVVKDGQWYQRGEMGWFGMSVDEMTQMEWQNKFNELVESLDPSMLLTMVDCHI